MNSLSTHDTPRVLSFLGTEGQHLSKEEQARHSLDGPQRREAMLLQRAAAFLQYVLPGCPCIYYGDEAGLEGLGDPFNRRFFPWQDCSFRWAVSPCPHRNRAGRRRRFAKNRQALFLFGQPQKDEHHNQNEK